MKITPPIQPYQGLRGSDAWGDGAFNARRSKSLDGAVKEYGHQGLDIYAPMNSTLLVVAPMDAITSLLGVAYPDDPLTPGNESDLRSVHLDGINAWDGLRVKLLYVRPILTYGQTVHEGQPIGYPQDRAGYAAEAAKYHKGLPTGPMRNHIHLETRVLENGVWVLKDPTAFLALPLASPSP